MWKYNLMLFLVEVIIELKIVSLYTKTQHTMRYLRRC